MVMLQMHMWHPQLARLQHNEVQLSPEYSVPLLCTVETENGSCGCVMSMICIALSEFDTTSAYVRVFICTSSIPVALDNAKSIPSFIA